jgi:hypothetical protein
VDVAALSIPVESVPEKAVQEQGAIRHLKILWLSLHFLFTLAALDKEIQTRL